ncbi:class I SAM-dependent methyltransferase [archaeon]|nr:MAG: class I SAM-dependent methyltransferase [archaeon]
MAYHGGYERSAPYYDVFDSKPNIAFFLSRVCPGSIVADVGAGTGRITLPLASLASHVYAIEPSPAMSAILERNVAQCDNVTVIASDAQSFSLPKQCDVTVLSGVYDHFLNDDERKASLSAIYECLKPGGILLMDAYIGSDASSPQRLVDECHDGPMTYLRYIGRSADDGVVNVSLRYEAYRDGMLVSSVSERSPVSVSTPEGVRKMLGHTGFCIEHIWCDYAGTPFEDGSDTLVVKARRR